MRVGREVARDAIKTNLDYDIGDGVDRSDPNLINTMPHLCCPLTQSNSRN